MEPDVGPVEPQDTLELMRDALQEGLAPERLPVTERTKATAQAAVQPFSFDVHVKLGMELLALRQQEANVKLNAEEFGEKLRRRAFVRDMLKRVAKEDNWVQYPASDLQRISRALARSGSGEDEEEDEDSDEDDDGTSRKGKDGTDPSAIYAKWLERRRRGPTRRAAFGTSVSRKFLHQTELEKRTNAVPNGAVEPSDAGGAMATGGPRPGTEGGPAASTSGSAPQLTGPVQASGGGSRPGSAAGGAGLGAGGVAAVPPASRRQRRRVAKALSMIRDEKRVSYNKDGPIVTEIRGGSDEDAGSSDDEEDDDTDIRDAAELLGLGRERRRLRLKDRTRSELLAAAAAAVGEVQSEAPTAPAAAKPDWRTVLRGKGQPAPSTEASAGVGAEPEAGSDGVTPAPGDLEAEYPPAPSGPPVPDMAEPLSALEAAATAVAALSDEQLQTAGRAANAAAGADAADGDVAAVVEAAAEWLAAALEGYRSAHAAKLDAIAAHKDLALQLQLLREWRTGPEQQRLEAATATLKAQQSRLQAAAAAGGSSSLLTRLLEGCAAMAAAAGNMTAEVAAEEEDAAVRAEEQERRRAALRLIEEECVRLAEEMAAREETDRLAELMAAEAEAERRMAEAKDEEEARQHALLAAMLMGEEEWVLEREARLAALRAAERDAARLGALRAGEEEKARAAARAGQPHDSSLLRELQELEAEAKREVALRRERLEEAVRELAQMESLRRQEQERQAAAEARRRAASADASAPSAPATDAAAATPAADVADVADAATAGVAEPGLSPAPMQPAASTPPSQSVASSAPSSPPAPSPPPPLTPPPADASPEALVHAAVDAVLACCSKADAAAQASSDTGGDPDTADSLAELKQLTSTAQVRLAAARAALESVLRLREAQRGTATAAAATPALRLQAEQYNAARREVAEGLEMLAGLVVTAGDGRRRALLAGVLSECSALHERLAEAEARVTAEVEARAPPPAAQPEATGEASEAGAVGSEGKGAAPPPQVEPSQSAPLPLPRAPLSSASLPENVMNSRVLRTRSLEPSSFHSRLSQSPLLPPPPLPALPQQQAQQVLQSQQSQSQSAAGAGGLMPLRSRSHAAGFATTVTIGFDASSGSAVAEWNRGSRVSAPSGSLPSTGANGSGSALPYPAAAAGAVRSGPSGRLNHHGGIAPPYAAAPALSSTSLKLLVPLQPTAAPPGVSGSASSPSSVPPEPPASSSPTLVAGRLSFLHLSRPGGSTDHLPPLTGYPSGAAASAPLTVPQPPPPPPPPAAPPPGPAWSPRESESGCSSVDSSPASRGAPTPPGLSPTGRRPPYQPALSPLGLSASQQQQQQGPPAGPAADAGLPSAGTATAGALAVVAAGTRQVEAGGNQALLAPLPGHGPGPPPPAGDGGAGSVLARKQPSRNVITISGAIGGAQGEGSPHGPLLGTSSSHSLLVPPPLPALSLAQPAQPPPMLAVARSSSNANGGSSGGGAPVPPLGNLSYTQWVAAHKDATPRALEAARQVDEVLSRLPPELHSVLLNAAELLTAAGVETPQLLPLGGGSGAASSGGAAGDAYSNLPAHLRTLPPVVSKYIVSQLQRIYNNAAAVAAGAAAGSTDKSFAGGAAHAVADGPGAGTVLGMRKSGGSSGGGVASVAGGFASLGSEQSTAVLQLFNQMLPALTQGVAQVRTRMVAAPAAAPAQAQAQQGQAVQQGQPAQAAHGQAPAAANPAAVVVLGPRPPLGFGALPGSQLKGVSRRARGLAAEADGGAPAPAPPAPGPARPQQLQPALQELQMEQSAIAQQAQAQQQLQQQQQQYLLAQQQAQQQQQHRLDGNGVGNGSVAGRRGKPGGGVGSRRRLDASGMERWTVRGINMQAGFKQSQGQDGGRGYGSSGSGGSSGSYASGGSVGAGGQGAVFRAPSNRDAFLPPLSSKIAATVRH